MQLQNNIFDIFDALTLLSNDISRHHNIFNLLPFSIYWKNKNSQYCGINNFTASELTTHQFLNPSDIHNLITKDDYAIFDKQTADIFRENDLKALNNPDEIHHCVETTILPSGHGVDQISLKRCILNNKLQPIGVLGCTINVNKLEDPTKSLEKTIRDSVISKLNKLVMRFMATTNNNLYSELAENLLLLIPLYPFKPELNKLLLLTKRELQCLCLLLKGYSAKSIALTLKVSFRTIEIYLSHIKEKLNLTSKSDATIWLWNVLSQL